MSATTRLAIMSLLKLNPKHPKADSVAIARLAQLNCGGKVCKRCDGSGKYSFNQIDGSRCYGCNGLRVTGIQFDADTLRQLQAKADEGVLTIYLTSLKARGQYVAAEKELMARWGACNFDSHYNWKEASKQVAGEWHRDVADINKRAYAANNSLPKLPSAERFRDMTLREQAEWAADFLRAFEAAKKEMEAVQQDLTNYVETNRAAMPECIQRKLEKL